MIILTNKGIDTWEKQANKKQCTSGDSDQLDSSIDNLSIVRAQ